MRVLLDTNIVVHRETSKVVNQDIGQLFNWIDRLHYTKCVHPLTWAELSRYQDEEVVRTMGIKLSSYHMLKTEASAHPDVSALSAQLDKNDNDINDSRLINEVKQGRVDCIITEDRKMHRKAATLGIAESVFTIESFLERVVAENPGLIDYRVLAVEKKHFGNINLADPFFDSFREDYVGFDRWYNRKADELAYVCHYRGTIGGFLFVKVEGLDENYGDMQPILAPTKRLKIGTFKVTLNGFRIGERFIKIVLDNALHSNVDEIYVTIFDKRPEQKRLIQLLVDFGFVYHGLKVTVNGEEQVFVKDFTGIVDETNPRLSIPFLSPRKDVYFVSIYPKYHTELFPDSILRTEVPGEYIDNEPHRNAISKSYISHALDRNLLPGDILLIYRTGGIHKGVVTTVCIVESVINNISSLDELVMVCRKRTVLSEQELGEYWNRFPKLKPFVVNLLYAYTLPKRLNLARLIELGIIAAPDAMPRGIAKISWKDFISVLQDAKANQSIIGH